MYFFKDTNGNWIIGESVDSIVSKVPCELRKSSPTTVAVRTVESRILLLAPIEVTALRKNAAGDFYANYAEFVAAVSDFFDNAPITAEEVDAKIGAEVDILSDRIDTVENIANASTGGSLGSIKPTDPAPTPARNGNYTFSISGTKPAWLTAEPLVTEVKAGDGVAVVYAEPSTYTYTHIDVSSDFASKDELVQVRSDLNYYNISESKPIYPLYYTLDTAVAAVPVDVRKKGLVVTYATSATTWETKQFFQGEIAAWTTVSNWKGFPYDITSNFSGGEGKVAGAVETKELKDNEEEFVYRGSLSKTFEIETQFAYDTTTVNQACSEGDVIAVKSGMPLNATESTVISITFTDSSNQIIGVPIFTKAGLTANITAPANSKFFLVEFAYTIAHTIPANTTVEINDIEVKNTSNIANRIVILEERKKVTEYVDIHVKKDFTGDFIDIQSAINSCNDASSEKIYNIYIHNDFLCTNVTSMWKTNTIGIDGMTPEMASSGQLDVYKSYITTRNYVRLIGVGDVKKITVDIPKSVAQQEKLEMIVPIHLRGNCEIINMEFISRNVRYTCHIESFVEGDNIDVEQKFNSVVFHHLGNPNSSDALGTWGEGSCFGCGTNSGQNIKAYKSKFIGNKLTIHTNVAFEKGCTVEFEQCNFDLGQKLYNNPVDVTSYSLACSIDFYDISSQSKNKLKVINCTGLNLISMYVQRKHGNYKNPWLGIPEFECYGCENVNLNIGSFYGEKINVLYAESNNIGNIITIAGGNGDAYDNIFGSEHITNSGSETTKSKSVGSVYLSDSADSDGKYSHAIGNILGNCTLVNKTLIVILKSLSNEIITQSIITFNKNYGGNINNPPLISQSQILTEINEQLTFGIISIGVEPSFPEFTDLTDIVVNSSSELIGKGCGIVYDYSLGLGLGRVRKATEGESIDGIAVDDLPVLGESSSFIESGKMLKKGNLIDAWAFWHPLKNESEWSYVAGKYYKIGSTPGNFIITQNKSEAQLIGIDNITYKII